MDKRAFSERDICTKFITPALESAGWDIATQVREEFPLTKGRIIVRGKLFSRARNKRADYVLFLKPNLPIAVIEAKDNAHTVGDGMQQALGYASLLEVPFAFSSNGDGFLFHNKLASDGVIEREISLNAFPRADQLWEWWADRKGLTDTQRTVVTQDYYSDGTDKSPRYYQLNAINKTVEAIARGQNRILLVMATGTGKTYTAFQIIWRLWRSRTKKRILFLADRNILVDQTMTNDFKPFGSAMTKIQKRQANKSYEIYGLNEAGKSTWLSAIADFLYGVPQNSRHGGTFGYDQIRLGATLVLSDGNRLVLRRRKGRGATLRAPDGLAVDESVLSSVLGPTTRERFTTLFGLGHMDLRSGGERLLAADGDIGRLVVEAGGGLRDLLTTIDTLRSDADKLFAPRRSLDRAFYKLRGDFEEAERSLKGQLKTREAFEQVQKLCAAAEEHYKALKEKRRQLSEKLSREQRVERVVPQLLLLDEVDARIKSFADLPPLPADFASSVRQAIVARDHARKAAEEAEERWSNLKKEMEAIVLPQALLDAEPKILDIRTRSGHVENERKSRPNRLVELATEEVKLATLRERIEVPPESDLAPLVPSKTTIDRVQAVIKEGLELRPKIEGLKAEINREERALRAVEERQAKRREEKVDTPLGISAAEVAPLARQYETLRTATAELERKTEEIRARFTRIGFSSLRELQELSCPDPLVVQTEIDREANYEAEIAKQIGITATHLSVRDAALASIARLRQAGEVPTDAAILGARNERQAAWVPIRSAFIAEDSSALSLISVSKRQKAALELEQHTGRADQLSDRKSLEAQRITDLASAEKTADDAIAAMNASTAAKDEVELKRADARFRFAEAWSDALQAAGGLTELKALVLEREEILKGQKEAEKILRDLRESRADYDARMEQLTGAEQRLGLASTEKTLAVRLQEVTPAIAAHNEGHDAFRYDLKAASDINDRLADRHESLAALQLNHKKWVSEYEAALRDIHLPSGTSPDIAGMVVNEWAAASGIFVAIQTTRKRLSQFETDEKELTNLIAGLAHTLDFDLPEDPVAAAMMLEKRLGDALKAETRKAALEPQLRQHDRDRDGKQRALRTAESSLEVLCEKAMVDEGSLLEVAIRQEALTGAKEKRDQIVEGLTSAGDGRSLAALHEEWGGRDLDGVRAEIAQIRMDIDQVDADIEAASTNAKERRQDLEPFEAEAGVNTATGQRESAAAGMHEVVSRYIDLTLARALLENAVSRVRAETQDPLLQRAGELFALVTKGSFSDIGTEIDSKGAPVVVGRRPSGEEVTLDHMSDGTRDQLFLACRVASVLQYCESAEPLPFIADDLLVHFDDERSDATLQLLAEIGKTTQVLLFTHHKNVQAAVARLACQAQAGLVDLN